MIALLLTLHTYTPYLVLAVAVITGVWGLILYFKKMEANKAWRSMLAATAIIGALQGLFGLLLLLNGLKPGGGKDLYYLHYVYGGIVALGIPVALTYSTSGKDKRRDLLIFSIAVLILAAAGVRALMTGPA